MTTLGARPWLCASLAGNPAILGFDPRTGGFASPPRDGFALNNCRGPIIGVERLLASGSRVSDSRTV